MKKQKGFIALISAIIIGALLLTLTVGVSMTGLFGKFNILDSESKERSVGLAEACADTAIYDFSLGLTYTNPIPVGSDNCTIVSITDNEPTPGKALIKTQASFNKTVTNLIIQIDNSALTIDSWEECSNLTPDPAAC